MPYPKQSVSMPNRKELSGVCADQNRVNPAIVWTAKLDHNKEAELNLSHDQLRDICGVSSMHAANINSLSITTDNKSSGITATSLLSGDGHELPITDKSHCAVNDGSATIHAHHISMPQNFTTTEELHLKTLPTDPHGFVSHRDLGDDEKQRINLNAGLYGNVSPESSERDMYKGVITAEKAGKTLSGIPLDQGANGGSLSAAATRAVLSKTSLSSIAGPGARIVNMPHSDTGVDTRYLVGSKEHIDSTATQIRKNTDIPGTYKEGWKIKVTGAMSPQCRQGDLVHHRIVLNREPLGDKAKVTLMKDIVPQEFHGTAPGLMVATGMNDQANRYTALMFGKGAAKSGAADFSQKNEDPDEGGGK